MSEFKRRIGVAAQVAEQTLLSISKDANSGMAAFFSGEHARTHEPERVTAESTQERGADVDHSADQRSTPELDQAELGHDR